MGTLTRQHDWANTSLGTPDQWPYSLRVSVSNLLRASMPMLVLWGEDHLCFYNDAVIPSLGPENHPALGKPAREVWGKGWDFVGPLLEKVLLTGEPVSNQDAPVTFHRHGQIEEAYWTFSYSQVLNDEGTPGGVLVSCLETTETVRARRDLEESQQQLLYLFEQSLVGIAFLEGDDLVFQMANLFYGQLVDRSPEQLLGKPLQEALPELAAQGFEALLLNILATGVPYMVNEVEVELIRNNQPETIYVDLTYQPRRETAHGPVKGILVVATEVTQQVQSRQALNAEQTRLNTILREIPVGILIANPNGELIYGNPQVEQIFRHPFRVSKDIEAYKNWALYDPQTGEPFPLEAMPMVRTLFHGETVVGVEMKLMRGDGSWGYASVNTVPIYDEQGQILYGVSAFVDITERKQTEEALRLSEGRLRAVLESISDALYIGGLEGITLVNQAALDQLGFTTPEELNRHIGTLAEEIQTRDWQTGEFIPVERQAFALALGGEHVVQDVRVRHRLSGEERVVRCAASPVVVEGKVVAAVAINSDVSRQRQAEEALRQSEERYRQLSKELENRVQARTNELQIANLDLKRSNANLQQFAYVASHDLQEPLRKIQSFSTLLQKKHRTELGAQGIDMLGRIVQAGERMSILIEDLLIYSRIETRQQALGLVSLNKVITKALHTLDWQIEERKAHIEVPDLPAIHGNESQLVQLFQNLLSNAIKFTRQGEAPQIVLSCTDHERRELPMEMVKNSTATHFRHISIRDQGIGFDTKYLDRIFQVFQRLHGKNEFPGTGVGLAICQRVVENHGGSITASSEPGKGATFSIYLPM